MLKFKFKKWDHPCWAQLALLYLPSGYEVDGVVLKLNELQLQSLLGHSGADPEWAIALKFPAQEALTKLTGLSVNIGRSGQVSKLTDC
jgi:NAD-dependent DNA ligase